MRVDECHLHFAEFNFVSLESGFDDRWEARGHERLQGTSSSQFLWLLVLLLSCGALSPGGLVASLFALPTLFRVVLASLSCCSSWVGLFFSYLRRCLGCVAYAQLGWLVWGSCGVWQDVSSRSSCDWGEGGRGSLSHRGSGRRSRSNTLSLRHISALCRMR